ncbi:hypothetical protein GCM10027037_04210 [Mucilaginibacter koreensis]
MPTTNNLTTQRIQPASIVLRALLGAGIALILIIVFLSGVKHPKPEWGNLWMVKPLIVVPLAGAAGGAFSYLTGHFFTQHGWHKALAIVIGCACYIIALWVGTVLGLNGTLWN